MFIRVCLDLNHFLSRWRRNIPPIPPPLLISMNNMNNTMSEKSLVVLVFKTRRKKGRGIAGRMQIRREGRKGREGRKEGGREGGKEGECTDLSAVTQKGKGATTTCLEAGQMMGGIVSDVPERD